MQRILTGCIFSLLFIMGCSDGDQRDSSDGSNQKLQSSTPNENIEVLVENLDSPWSINKLDEIFYVSEKRGNIVKIENGNSERQEVELEQEVSSSSEAGFLGFVLSPDFSESNMAYAYYTYEGNDGQYNRIVTLRLNNDVWYEENLLLDELPSGTYHHGGRLKIGPDQKLYATVGDASEPELAQNINSLAGKILRLNLDGTIPEDNPIADSFVYSYGHRNPQGITWTPDGTMYASEHGERANDEINLIRPNQNYGWPYFEGDEQQEGMVSPLFTSGREQTWAPSGVAYHNNSLYIAALRGAAILEFDLETNDQRELVTDLGRIRDIFIEDNDLYFISNNLDGRGVAQEDDDKLYRMSLSN